MKPGAGSVMSSGTNTMRESKHGFVHFLPASLSSLLTSNGIQQRSLSDSSPYVFCFSVFLNSLILKSAEESSRSSGRPKFLKFNGRDRKPHHGERNLFLFLATSST
ncbi:hypothetical protein MHYP_G00073770 [Metynnis hypsauchen]